MRRRQKRNRKELGFLPVVLAFAGRFAFKAASLSSLPRGKRRRRPSAVVVVVVMSSFVLVLRRCQWDLIRPWKETSENREPGGRADVVGTGGGISGKETIWEK